MPKSATSADPALYCRKCSYDLRGQVEHRCPECGRAYDPADAKTYRRRPKGRAGRWIRRIAAALVVLVLLAAAPYAWLYYDWRQEQAAIGRMEEVGACVGCEGIDLPVLPRLLPERFEWMLSRVYYADVSSKQITDSDLILLARCRRLGTLLADGGSITDRGVEAISDFRNLHRLQLSGTGITDASATHLAQCRGLSRLDLYETSLTDEGENRLRQSLPNCRILVGRRSRVPASAPSTSLSR